MSTIQKSIRELSWDVTEEEYRADPALSYSTLSRFEREGWRKLYALFDKIQTPALVFGSAVDTMLTEEESFSEKFYVCEFPPLSDTLIKITKALYERFGDKHRSLNMIKDEHISEVAIANNYYVNDKYASFRVKSIKECCDEYYSLLYITEEATILSEEDYRDVLRCVQELKGNPVTKEFFTQDSSDGTEIIYQLKFKADYEGLPIRCMFDILKVDHKNKIIWPIDLKTTGQPEENFKESFIKWRYDIQAQLYTYALQESVKDDSYFKEFKVAHYQFIVINRRTLSPLIWNFYENFAKEDLKDESGKVYRNWRKILVDLVFYLSNPATKYSKESIEANYSLDINNLIKI